MKQPLLVICLLCLSGMSLYAQDKKPFHRSTYIKVNPARLINQLEFTVEQELTQRLSLELGVAGIYTDYPDYILARKIDIGQKKPDISTEQFVDGRGLGFSASLRWYLVTQKDDITRAQGTYFQPVLTYKKVFYPNEKINIRGTEYENTGDKDVYAIQFLLGRQITRDRFVIDPYVGLGVRAKVYDYNNFYDNNGVADSRDGRLISVLPSLHLGIKIGLRL
ncbi:hypothetical protein [Chitinophaga pinensis]|uniref:DUF3575 domain-containing protein n=1 Tax=Chitinophaga pinensis (strain ATCC 43595 / DSM 2588 / LMG 13176 / NBRC 15968 / NCIMB 11800 / UQM 2034) TaxID=485918 RepID=A0A979FZF5_CHIPD|nr:hypothetical protein [Chitinophaga pinensis]ACU58029.1 hypothetical protein Cpin_0531 [Chitinophaga pinensis DSM 2588]